MARDGGAAARAARLPLTARGLLCVIRLEHRHPEPDGPTSVASLPFASTSARARVSGGVWVKMAAEGARECRVCEGMAQFRQAGGSGDDRVN